MTLKRLEEIFTEDHKVDIADCDNAFEGLLIMAKYLGKGTLIRGAGHDEIYGPSGAALVNAGLTEEDAVRLAVLNWRYSHGSFVCYV